MAIPRQTAETTSAQYFGTSRVADVASSWAWLQYAGASVLPVVFICYQCCYYEQAESLLGLFAVEWLLVLVVWRVLCPWLGTWSVVFAAIPFLLCRGIAMLLVRECVGQYEAAWHWSDDLWYLTHAEDVVHVLHSSRWNLLEAWLQLTSIWVGAAWTLVGWPFLLGLVGACVTSQPSLEMLHAIALSLNATCLTLVLALLYHVLATPARQFPGMLLLCFLLLIADPIVFAATSLKESLLQLCIMLVFVSSVCMTCDGRLRWILPGLLGCVGVLTTRPAYIPLLGLVLFGLGMVRLRMDATLKIVLAVTFLVASAGTVLSFRIRQTTIGERLQMGTLQAEDGIAMTIYHLPVVGPVIFYAISPVPPLPWKLLSSNEPLTTLIRSAGSLAWLLAAAAVLRRLCFNPHLLGDKRFAAASVMFAGLFTAVVLTGDDPRYKQPTNFFLAIMLFLVWYDQTTQSNGAPGVANACE